MRLLILVDALRASHNLINKGPQVPLTLRIHKMQARGRNVGKVAVLAGGIAGRNETRKHNRAMQNPQNGGGDPDFDLVAHTLFSPNPGIRQYQPHVRNAISENHKDG